MLKEVGWKDLSYFKGAGNISSTSRYNRRTKLIIY